MGGEYVLMIGMLLEHFDKFANRSWMQEALWLIDDYGLRRRRV
jgi:hypothetical protein